MDRRVRRKPKQIRQRLAATLPAEFNRWGALARAQYLEMTTFLAGYLLSSQGDRMLMGNSVEGRFPFLDHELAEFAGGIPASIKLQSLDEKSILKASVAGLLPPCILQRSKQPFRAPDSSIFLRGGGHGFVEEHMGPEALATQGIWEEDRVATLLRKWQTGNLTSQRENMGFLGILSTQILARQFGPDLAGRIEAGTLAAGQLVWRQPPV